MTDMIDKMKNELTSFSLISQATCSPNDFTCNDGTCIDRSSVCDGINNCPSGNDEVLCSKMFINFTIFLLIN